MKKKKHPQSINTVKRRPCLVTYLSVAKSYLTEVAHTSKLINQPWTSFTHTAYLLCIFDLSIKCTPQQWTCLKHLFMLFEISCAYQLNRGFPGVKCFLVCVMCPGVCPCPFLVCWLLQIYPNIPHTHTHTHKQMLK